MGEAQDREGKTGTWSQNDMEGSRMLARAEMIKIWKKIKRGIEQGKISSCKPLLRIEIPEGTHLQWAGNAITATRNKKRKRRGPETGEVVETEG